MPKRAARVAMPENMRLDAASPLPLHRQLYSRLREGILAGQIPAGARLPSTRALASYLGVSRTTTAAAYDELVMEGYLESRVGNGTQVSALLPEPGHSTRAWPKEVAAWGSSLASFSRPGPGGTSPFLVGLPDTEAFPFALWVRLLARQAKTALKDHMAYQDVAGYPPLRSAIAAHIIVSRGVRCTPEQVLITAGAQGALYLAACRLLSPGETAWVEIPATAGLAARCEPRAPALYLSLSTGMAWS